VSASAGSWSGGASWCGTAESSHLALEADSGEDALPTLQGHSVTYRVAFGARQGQKAFTLQTLAPRGEDRDGERVAQANGFSLHAGVAAVSGNLIPV